jgi:dephospho-CoA kinase
MANSDEKLLRIGLTGGIASGKTVTAELFAELGAQIIDTDDIARQLVAPGQPALADIAATFGSEILTPDGELDRAKLRERVFETEADRRRLEAILHPRIRRTTLERAAAAGGPYQVLVVPLLLETGFEALVDRILVVDCPESLQRQRLLERDGEDQARVDHIMAAQLHRAERLKAADDVIDNAGSLAETRTQVQALHKRYLELAGDP